MKERTVTHLNIIGFRAAVAEIKDKHLCGRPFVIAGATGGRCLALDCSPEAVRQGVTPGTALALAERKIKDLLILSPDPPAYDLINKELEKAQKDHQMISSKLKNEGFTAKAPANVVEAERVKLMKLEDKLRLINSAIERL